MKLIIVYKGFTQFKVTHPYNVNKYAYYYILLSENIPINISKRVNRPFEARLTRLFEDKDECIKIRNNESS